MSQVIGKASKLNSGFDFAYANVREVEEGGNLVSLTKLKYYRVGKIVLVGWCFQHKVGKI